MDILECIIGIGKNLFYNSPMEACIIICKSNKINERKGKVLFIDAKKEITRKDAFSFLEDKHIKKIVDTYNKFCNIDNFSAVETNENLLNNNSSLSVQFYVEHIVEPPTDDYSFEEYYNNWLNNSDEINDNIDSIINILSEEDKYE